jgi:cellulose synthase/poly-beta-1,6-N-acetylglucosamine synthase-like glycosyltransferase
MAALIIFLLSAAYIGYVLFGYPAILGLLARWRCRPVKRAPCEPTVSVLLPVHNGEPWIAAKLDSLLALDYPRDRLQIIVISDGSTDRTEEIARQYAAQGVELLRLPRGGKAQALNAGMKRASGEVLFLTDVRQPLEPESLRNLTACLADPAVGAVSGELVILDDDTREKANVGLYWRYEKWIRKRLSQVDSVLGATGAIYIIRKSLARPMPPSTLLDDVYLPLGAFFSGYRVVFEESAIAYDRATVLDTEFRRKVRTLAGVYQIVRYFPHLISFQNRMWFHFLSHKIGRLFLPYALLALAISSFWLPAPWRTLALGSQAGFYALAAIDRRLPDSLPLKRLSSPACTFVVLVAAALCAIAIFFVPTQSLWKSAARKAAA